jgi:hypothetical protein
MQCVYDDLNLFLGNRHKGLVLREIRLNEAMGISIESPFQGRIRGVREKRNGPSGSGNGLMTSEFSPIYLTSPCGE